MKGQIQEFLKKEYPDIKFDVFYPPSRGRSPLRRDEGPPEGFGDYSTNIAFLLAKKSGRDSKEVAEEIVGKIRQLADKREFEKIRVAENGFINFYLSKEYLQNNLSKILKLPNIDQRKNVIIEYSQPNIAKVMHVGHLRSTILGDALANIHESLGYKVIRWNYLGDWGTQFGKLIAAYKLWGNEEEVRKDPIEILNNLYVRFHEELKSNPELESKGGAEFKKLEEGDKENRKLWEWFRKESLKEFRKIYEILGITFDTYNGESFFEKDLKLLIKELKSKGLAQESEGALIINLNKFNLLPALIQKSDGASLYLTRDIAALKYRFLKYKPEKMLYVVGNEQSFHFQQLFAVAKILGFEESRLFHIKFGLVLGADKKKLATREGKTVPLEKLIDRAVELALKTVLEKNPELPEKEKVAKAVGVGALKYFILKEHRNTDIVFDWNKILDLRGDSGPYLQYTYARLAGIKRKAPKKGKPDFQSLDKDIELSLMKKLIRFPEVVASAGENNLPNVLTLYLYGLCNLANSFYESAPVLQEGNEKIKSARLGLVDLTNSVLKRGLNLLGIETPERI